MSVAIIVLEYAKELMNRKDPMTGESKEDDYHIGEILYELGSRIMCDETEAMRRKYEANMSLDKAIEHKKEWRKQYHGSKAIDKSCRNHGSCSWCRGNRTFKFRYKHGEDLERSDYYKKPREKDEEE